MLVLLSGCGPTDLSDVELPIPRADAEIQPANRTQIVEVANTDEASPVSENLALPGIAASPVDVCKRFLQELNRENPDQFGLLLTPAALTVANRMKFDLPPVAQANAKFKFGDARYASIRQQICFVDCQLEEQTDSEQTTITWMMRKSNSGWRVAGMLVPGNDDSLSNLLSFESKIDLAQIRDSLSESVSATLD